MEQNNNIFLKMPVKSISLYIALSIIECMIIGVFPIILLYMYLRCLLGTLAPHAPATNGTVFALGIASARVTWFSVSDKSFNVHPLLLKTTLSFDG